MLSSEPRSPPLRAAAGTDRASREDGGTGADRLPWWDEAGPEPGCDPCPAKVSPAVWEAVFPPDRAEVRRMAGRYYVQNMSADEAVVRAAAVLQTRAMRAGSLAPLLARLESLFPRVARDAAPPAARRAALAVRPTAGRAWRGILAHEGGKARESAAFRLRTWHPPRGCCMVCEEAAEGEETFQGDPVHARCRGAMREIGPAFAALVIEEAERQAELCARPVQPWPEEHGDDEPASGTAHPGDRGPSPERL